MTQNTTPLEADEQISFVEHCAVGVAYGCDSAIRILNKYLEM